MKILIFLLCASSAFAAGVGGGYDAVDSSLNATNGFSAIASNIAAFQAMLATNNLGSAAFVPSNTFWMVSSNLMVQGTNGSSQSVGTVVSSSSNSLWLSASNIARLSTNSLTADGLTNSITTQAANYSIQATDGIVLLSGARTATLPTAVGIPGRVFTIKCTSSGTNAILTTSSQTIDGAAKWTNTAINKFTTVISDGANWRIIGSN